MSYKQLKWLILLIPTITVGLWEYVRHEYLLPYISMDLGNWLTPVIVLFVTFTLLTRLFTKIELMQEQLQRERTEKVALEERERIARELHDGMAQSLFLLSVKMKQLKKLDVAKKDEGKLADIEQSVIHIHDYVRTGIENLREPIVDKICFLQTVEAEIDSFEHESGLTVSKDIEVEENTLTVQEKQELLFCLKESLMNIHKHANATKVQLFIRIKHDEKMISVNDNGVGFQVDKPLVGHYGIRMMQERCERIGWNFYLNREAAITSIQFVQKSSNYADEKEHSQLKQAKKNKSSRMLV